MKVGKYQFELKNIKHIESRSEETNCFGAVLYVNNKKFANCGNSGHGGPTDVNILPECRELGKDVIEFLKTQPKIKPEGYDFDLELELDLEYIVDMLLYKYLQEKEHQKIMRKTEKSLVFEKKGGNYFIFGWRNQTIASMLSNSEYRELVRKTIAEEEAKGNKLINENIPAELLP